MVKIFTRKHVGSKVFCLMIYVRRGPSNQLLPCSLGIGALTYHISSKRPDDLESSERDLATEPKLCGGG